MKFEYKWKFNDEKGTEKTYFLEDGFIDFAGVKTEISLDNFRKLTRQLIRIELSRLGCSRAKPTLKKVA